MLTEEQIRQDLTKLKDIVIAHKAPDAELATHKEIIDGQEYFNMAKELGHHRCR